MPDDPDSRRQVDAVCEAVAGDDEAVLQRVLHPYLRFTDPTGRMTRGRRKVIELLREVEELPPPDDVELRDGQVYRWICRTS